MSFKMRKLFIIAMLGLFLLSSAFANERLINPSVFFRVAADQKCLELKVLNLLDRKASLRIEDESGSVILQENVENLLSYITGYNVEKLPAGTYRFVVETETATTSQLLMKGFGGFALEGAKKVAYKPIFSKNGPFVDIQFAKASGGKVQVIFYDKTGKEVMKEEWVQFPEAGRSYNLRSFAKGAHRVVVKKDNQEFSYQMTTIGA